MATESIGKVIKVAAGVCVVCSIFVSTVAVNLKPLQEANKVADKKRNILIAAGFMEDGQDVDIDKLFEKIITKVIDVKTGDYADDRVNLAAYDERKAAGVISESYAIANDMAGIRRVAKYKAVYLVKEDGKLKRVILPVHGKGLWSTMYGFLALGEDLKTIKSFAFYEHGETPGLGGEVDNPRWKAQWSGKLAFDDEWKVKITVLKGTVQPGSANANSEVDGLGGSTLTTNGVRRLVRFWLGEAENEGYGPYLEKLRQGGHDNG